MTFLDRLNPHRIPSGINPDDSLLVLRERGLQYIFLIASGLGILAYLQILPIFIPRKVWGFLAIYGIALALVLGVTIIRTIGFRWKAYLLLILIYTLGITSLMESGLSGSGKVFLLTFAVLSAIFLGVIPGGISLLLCIASYVIIGWLMTMQIIPTPEINVLASTGRVSEWLNDGLLLVLMILMILSVVNALNTGIESAIQKQHLLNEELHREKDGLEDRVKERVTQTERRAALIEAAAELAHKVSMEVELEDLLRNSAELIREQFGLYYVGIFLVDDRNEYALLRSATGDAGRVMLANHYRLKVGEIGIVDYVISKGKARVILNVEEDAFHFKNPLLPETRSEVALPLRAGTKVIGALDVQSQQAYAFSPDDVKTLQMLATQLAVAIEKAHLVQQLQEDVRILENSFVQQSAQSWLRHLKNVHKNYAYRFSQEKIEEIPLEEGAAQTLRQQTQINVVQVEEKGHSFTRIELPIKLRDLTLGNLDIKFEEKTVSPGTIRMLETITERLSTALENARLLEEIQFRAEREHLVSDITSQIRSETEVENILRTAALEIGEKMGIAKVVVQLRSDD